MATGTVVVCPKCGHARSPTDTARAWQCPACGIAYSKYQAVLERARPLVTPPGAADPAPSWSVDGSVWSLVAVNVLSLALAYHLHWSLAWLMLLYWGQSVIIGVANVLRISSLQRFSTENFTMNGKRVEPTPATRTSVAVFFALHYGIFHLAYAGFLIGAASRTGGLAGSGWWWLAVAGFALNHFWSYRYNREVDRRGTPNIGTLMFTPYLRVVPMHVMILSGIAFAPTTLGLLLFGALKIVADVGMHLVEHAQLQKVRDAPPASP